VGRLVLTAQDGEIPPYRPLTERVLDRLPGWRWAWMVGWALLGGGPYLLAHQADPGAPYPGDPFAISLSWAALVSLCGAGVVTRRLDALQPALAELLPAGMDPPSQFRAVGSRLWPVVGAVLVTASFEVIDFVAAPTLATGLRIVPAFFANLASAAFLLAVAALLYSIYRVGALPLRLRPFHADPGLGLKAFGRLAFAGFGIFLLAFAPVFAVTTSDVRSWVINLLILLVSVSLFFLSLSSLHHQLAAAKAERLAWARRLYGNAVELLEGEADAQALAARSASLVAAAEIERKVQAIPEWPIDDWIWRTLAAILIGATAGVVARAIGAGLAI